MSSLSKHDENHAVKLYDESYEHLCLAYNAIKLIENLITFVSTMVKKT